MVTELAQIAFSYEHLSGKTSLQQLEKEKFYRLEVLPMTRRMKLLGMPDTAEAVEDVYEHARIVIDPLAPDKAVAASTVEQKRDKALSTLKASLEQEATPPAVLKRKRKKTPASPKKP